MTHGIIPERAAKSPSPAPTAMAPDASTSPVEWVPEIRVDGKRPEWLDDCDRFKLRECGFQFYDDLFSASEVDWHEEVEAIRLPADHPHYRQPTTPERDPALWDRMEALVRRMAVIDYGEINAMSKARADAHWEARAIVAALPKPVDPAAAAVERLLSEYEGAFICSVDETLAAEIAYKAFALGRELSRQGDAA